MSVVGHCNDTLALAGEGTDPGKTCDRSAVLEVVAGAVDEDHELAAAVLNSGEESNTLKRLEDIVELSVLKQRWRILDSDDGDTFME